jgi:ABC-type Zn2+ transport system substrate-binding protein/surface adhesin
MRPAYRAHEVDDGHDHHAWGDNHKSIAKAVAVDCRCYVTAYCHKNEEKCAPELGKYSSPLQSWIEKIRRQLHLEHPVLLCRMLTITVFFNHNTSIQ